MVLLLSPMCGSRNECILCVSFLMPVSQNHLSTFDIDPRMGINEPDQPSALRDTMVSLFDMPGRLSHGILPLLTPPSYGRSQSAVNGVSTPAAPGITQAAVHLSYDQMHSPSMPSPVIARSVNQRVLTSQADGVGTRTATGIQARLSADDGLHVAAAIRPPRPLVLVLPLCLRRHRMVIWCSLRFLRQLPTYQLLANWRVACWMLRLMWPPMP